MLAAAITAAAADYYVDPNKGADANDGSISAPWRHLSHAGRRLRPGDTVYLRAGTYSDDSLFTTTDGTEDAPITICAVSGEKAVLTGKGIYDQIMHLNNDHYVISGLTFEDTRCYNVLYVNSSEHVTIRNCRFSKQTGTMILARGGGYHTIEKNTFDTTGSPQGPGSGDHIYVAGSHHNLIQENRFIRAGHAACDQIESGDLRSHHNILRNNVVEQHWGGGFYVIRGSSRSLLENNRIYYAGKEMEYPKAGFQLAADDNIVRFNVVAETGARPHSHNGMTIAGYRFSGIDQHARNNAVYNNVFYKVGRAAIAVSQRQACQVTGNKTFNNIVYHGRVGGPHEPWWPDGNYYLTFETYHAFADNKWKAFPNDNFFHHNLILHADPHGDHPGEDPVVFCEPEGWGHCLEWVEANFPRHFHHNLQQNPRFVNAEGRDFRLRGDSPAIDRGGFLTRTTAASQAATQVPVTDASLFCDGWGRIEGDLVRVGKNPPRRLIRADYDRNTLVLESPVSFAADTPVSLPYHDAAPDMGAIEFASQ
jgi:hypothetical protein